MRRLLLIPYVLAGPALLAACGQSSATPSPSPTIPAGCNTPAGFVFTDGSARITVSGGTRSGQALNVTGVWNEPFESSRPNLRYDPTAYRGSPWLNVNLGSASTGLVVEVQGQDPCALSPDGSHSYVAVVFGRDDASRYGGNCSVTVDAFNNSGFRGRFNCMKLEQFGANSNAPTIDAQGTFAASGHPYTPTAAPTATPTRTPAATSTPAPTATARPTATPLPTPTSLVTP